MRNSNLRRLSVARAAAIFSFLLLTPLALFAQTGTAALTPEQVVGSYKGNPKLPADDSFTLEIKSDKGKLSGHLLGPLGDQPFSSIEIAGNKLNIKLGTGPTAATLIFELKDGKLVGDWTENGKTSPIEFRKAPSAAEVAQILTGDWNAVADAQGSPFEFLLTFKVEGETITGSSSSQLGTSTISSGNVKDGKLVFILDGSNGKIAMTATLTDGKLVGDFDYSGQLTGKWVATKKPQ